jgi:peroxiredoxin
VDTYGVAWAGDESSFQSFIDRHDLAFPELSDPDDELYADFGIVAQPALSSSTEAATPPPCSEASIRGNSIARSRT